MKVLLFFCALFLSMSAFAGNDCNEVKTAYHLYKAEKSIVSLPSCRTPFCVLKNTKRTEKHFCKAVNACEPIAEEFHYPCTADNKLTDEAKQNAKRVMIESLEKAIEYIKSITKGKSGNEESDDDSDDESEDDSDEFR